VAAIAILGPGGVGGFLAAALWRAGEPVVVVARESTAAHIARHGIEVQSTRLGSFGARPATTPVLQEPAQVLIVATKATGLQAALERVRQPPELVVPLLNGLDHMELLRERFGNQRVAAGAIRIESSSPEPGQIRQTSPFLRVDLAGNDVDLAGRRVEVAGRRVEVAGNDPARLGRIERLAEALERAGIPARIESSEAYVLWSKLVRLVALACTTSASGQTIGFIRSDPEWRTILVAAIEEAAAVSDAEGGGVDPAVPLGELDDAHPGLGSSMQRDLAAGREPELDAIAGAVLRAGRRHGIECPTIERLTVQIAERAGLAAPLARPVGPLD
jgi:2-dehydropantoate 2-reductase